MARLTGVTFTGAAVANPFPYSISELEGEYLDAILKAYYVYRADVAGGAYAKLTSSPISATFIHRWQCRFWPHLLLRDNRRKFQQS